VCLSDTSYQCRFEVKGFAILSELLLVYASYIYGAAMAKGHRTEQNFYRSGCITIFACPKVVTVAHCICSPALLKAW
jgi:hypothetical protein